MAEKTPPLKNVWITLGLPPIIFLLAIILASIYYSVQGQTNPEQISQSVANSMSVILVVIQVALLGIFLWAKHADQLSWRGIGWQPAPGQKTWQEFLIGAIP